MMSQRKRILFVDDERNVLDGLRRMLYPMREEWKMEFVTKGADALFVMESASYDVIVSDLQMPEMDGLELLETVREKYPKTIRFMLSGYSEQLLQSQAARTVHRFISKPCEAEQLREMVTRALALYDRLHIEAVIKVLSTIRSLPVMPDTYQEVIDIFRKPSCSLKQVGQTIAKDIGMSSKILQVVNGTSYGQRPRIADPVHAVTYLGQKAAEGLVLTNGIFSKVPARKLRKFSVMGLQEHCTRVGTLARNICKLEGFDREGQELANMAGILHDAGKMILISRFADEFYEAIQVSRAGGRPLHDIERELIGVTHAEIGGLLLDLWGLPSEIVEAGTFHHEPSLCLDEKFSIVTAVHIADNLDHELCTEIGGGCPKELDKKYIARLGLEEKLQQWRQQYIPLMAEEPEHVA